MKVNFYIVLSTDPPSSDVVRDDAIIQGIKEIGQSVRFKWSPKKDQEEIVEGRILDIGTKTRLLTRKVSAGGDFLLGDTAKKVGTRKQEVQKEKMRQLHAQQHVLQNVAEGIVANGPGAVCECQRPPPVRTPKKRSQERLDEIRDALLNLPCRQQGPNKAEIAERRGIWLDPGKLAILRLDHGLNPTTYFRELMKVLLGDMLKTDGLAVTSTRGCLKVPEDLVAAAVLQVRNAFRAAGGNPATIKFKPSLQIRRLLMNSRRRSKCATTSSAHESDEDFPDVNINDQEKRQDQAVSPTRPVLMQSPPVTPSSSVSSVSGPAAVRVSPAASIASDHSYQLQESPRPGSSSVLDISFNRLDQHEKTLEFANF